MSSIKARVVKVNDGRCDCVMPCIRIEGVPGSGCYEMPQQAHRLAVIRALCREEAHSEEAVERQAYGWYVEDVPGEVEDE